jgi:hypothetical protein
MRRSLEKAPLRRKNNSMPFDPIAQRSFFRKLGDAVEEVEQQLGAPHRAISDDGGMDWRCPIKSFGHPFIDRSEGGDAIEALRYAIEYLDMILRTLVKSGVEIYHDRECQTPVEE